LWAASYTLGQYRDKGYRSFSPAARNSLYFRHLQTSTDAVRREWKML